MNRVLGKMTPVDLSQTIRQDMPHWPGDPGTHIRQKSDVAQDGYFLNELTIGEHSGTHIGAPKHFGGEFGVDAIPPDQLIRPGVKINMARQAASNPDYLLSLQDVFEWEAEHGKILNRCLILVQTDWSERWPASDDYFGTDNDGMHFPGVSVEATEFLLKQRDIVGIGIDTAGVDGGQSNDYLANIQLARHNAYHLENLAQLKSIGDKDFFVFVGALKIKVGSGSPCRVFAFF